MRFQVQWFSERVDSKESNEILFVAKLKCLVSDWFILNLLIFIMHNLSLQNVATETKVTVLKKLRLNLKLPFNQFFWNGAKALSWKYVATLQDDIIIFHILTCKEKEKTMRIINLVESSIATNPSHQIYKVMLFLLI